MADARRLRACDETLMKRAAICLLTVLWRTPGKAFLGFCKSTLTTQTTSSANAETTEQSCSGCTHTHWWTKACRDHSFYEWQNLFTQVLRLSLQSTVSVLFTHSQRNKVFIKTWQIHSCLLDKNWRSDKLFFVLSSLQFPWITGWPAYQQQPPLLCFFIFYTFFINVQFAAFSCKKYPVNSI